MVIQDIGNGPNIHPSVRHHVFVKTGKKEVQLAEVGPRFEMKRKHSIGTFVSHQPLLTFYFFLFSLFSL